MKVLIVSNSDFEGGAARAAYRLHQGFKTIDIHSQMLVQVKKSDDKDVIGEKSSSGIGQAVTGLRLALDRLPLKLYPNRAHTTYSLGWLPDKIISKVNQINPSIINTHWINNGYIFIETIAKFTQPIVWTLHDLWAFTGGCHYNEDCSRYTQNCGKCPQLQSWHDWDISRWEWQRKAKAWKNLNLTIVTPSSWLAKCASSSSLFQNLQIKVIPNGLDIQQYRPINKQVARNLLNIPQDKQLILFGSLQATSDKRKGFDLLQDALVSLSKSGWKDKLEVIIFGASEPKYPPSFGFKSHYLGTLNDELTLALVYSSADVFVLPSRQDNLPNTVMEAMACGTPCVAFNIGGMPDMIEHQKNGYLAQTDKGEDLAQGIKWVLENQERHDKLSYYSRYKVEKEFTLESQANRYLSLFNEIKSA